MQQGGYKRGIFTCRKLDRSALSLFFNGSIFLSLRRIGASTSLTSTSTSSSDGIQLVEKVSHQVRRRIQFPLSISQFHERNARCLARSSSQLAARSCLHRHVTMHATVIPEVRAVWPSSLSTIWIRKILVFPTVEDLYRYYSFCFDTGLCILIDGGQETVFKWLWQDSVGITYRTYIIIMLFSVLWLWYVFSTSCTAARAGWDSSKS